MTAVIETEGLGKRYSKLWALAGCTLSIPAEHVVGLVGPNGAGKSTLLNLATGMLAPTTGTIEVLGGRPAAGPAQLARVGYLAQDAPLYAGLSVADHLRLGLLREGDQLPKVKDVAAGLAINPNTVLKAYRELEYEGLVAARPGIGTFVTGTLDGGSLAAHGPLRRELQRWLAKARGAGLDEESIEALFVSTFRSAREEDIA